MTFTRDQKKTAYKKLSVENQDFIMSSETTELIGRYINMTGLSEEQSISADTEILYAMLNLQSLSEAISNIAKLSNKNEKDLSELKVNLENNIFSKITVSKDSKPTGFNKNRVIEISQKYSLNQSQTDKLINIIDSFVTEPQEDELLLGNIMTNLGISRLLGEQIVDEVKNRVFDYTAKNIEGKKEVVGVVNTVTNKQKMPLSQENIIKKTILEAQKDIPEVRPQITPMIEPGESVHIVKPPVSTPVVETAKPQQFTPPVKPSPAPSQTSEFIQKPISVPRYTGAPTMETTEAKPANQVKPPEPVPPPVKKYAVDPYREPIE